MTLPTAVRRLCLDTLAAAPALPASVEGTDGAPIAPLRDLEVRGACPIAPLQDLEVRGACPIPPLRDLDVRGNTSTTFVRNYIYCLAQGLMRGCLLVGVFSISQRASGVPLNLPKSAHATRGFAFRRVRPEAVSPTSSSRTA